ncbi:MAG: hypothetical protein K2X47_14705 [Bdellovibrionales bacterium]|nr:hypothetical protein [Bdellovibrionales bacterium]
MKLILALALLLSAHGALSENLTIFEQIDQYKLRDMGTIQRLRNPLNLIDPTCHRDNTDRTHPHYDAASTWAKKNSTCAVVKLRGVEASAVVYDSTGRLLLKKTSSRVYDSLGKRFYFINGFSNRELMEMLERLEGCEFFVCSKE